jgi:hypothetical protein
MVVCFPSCLPEAQVVVTDRTLEEQEGLCELAKVPAIGAVSVLQLSEWRCHRALAENARYRRQSDYRTGTYVRCALRMSRTESLCASQASRMSEPLREELLVFSDQSLCHGFFESI